MMRSSEATWKVWGHSVPTLPMRLDLDSVDPEGETVVFTTDTWDGYLREREELMRFLETQEITNFVSLSGDNHNTFAGAVSPTYGHSGPEAAAEPTIGAEFSICGISSPSVFQALLQAVGPDSALRPLVTDDGRIQGDQEVSLNMTFLHGAGEHPLISVGRRFQGSRPFPYQRLRTDFLDPPGLSECDAQSFAKRIRGAQRHARRTETGRRECAGASIESDLL